NRESAAEVLGEKQKEAPPDQPPATKKKEAGTEARHTRKTKDTGEVIGDIAIKTATNIGTQIGKEIVRGMLGSWMQKR
ncbi:MAG: DUF853 domain-containing protein, partial [Methanospirillum sp.]|nr:DUF853 domain-containing protein [Methanospirillum sp.]